MRKLNKRLTDLLATRAGGGAYTGKKPDLPSFDAPTTGPEFFRAALSHSGFAGMQDPMSLATKEGVIPMPDEEEIERARRRKAARRGGGRASTVLSDENRLGG